MAKKEPIQNVLVRLGPKLHRQLALRAAHEGVSMNELMIEAVMAKIIDHDLKVLHERMAKNRKLPHD